MKKFIFDLYPIGKEKITIEIYSDSYTEAKINATVTTGIPDKYILFIEETESLVPQQWIF